MMIVLIPAAALAISVYFLSESFRGFLDTIFYGIGEFYEDHRNLFIGLAIALFSIPPVILLVTGWYVHAMNAMIFFLIFFPIFVLMSIRRGLRSSSTPVPRSTGGFMRFAVIAVLTVAVFNIAVGLWSPEIKNSLDRWTGNKKQEIANWFNGSSITSDPERGIFAWLSEDGYAYASNEGKVEKIPVKKGDKVMVIDLEGKKADKVSEGIMRVKLKDNDGDFMTGKEAWIPTRKLSWNHELKNSGDDLPPKSASFTDLPYNINMAGVTENWDSTLERWRKGPSLKKGQYLQKVTGYYNIRLANGSVRQVPPEGIELDERLALFYKGRLPLPNGKFGCLLARVNGQIVPLEKEVEDLVIERDTEVLYTLNIPQDKVVVEKIVGGFISVTTERG